MRLFFCIAAILLLPAHQTLAQQAPSSDGAIVLVRSGETREIKLEGECKRITNKAAVAIGIETGPSSRWPKVFDPSSGSWPKPFEGQIRITKCKE